MNTQGTPSPLLLASADVAEMLGVPASTLSYWARTGQGPKYVRIGRFRRYRTADVQAWVDQQFEGGETQ